jgi:hypothetical protein
MKTINNLLVAALAGLALALVASSAQAQYKPTGGDRITASPKVRAMLDERRARTTPVSTAEPTMACPKCKDIWVAQTDRNPKGSGVRTLMGQTTKRVAQHFCNGCGVDWALAGTGKAKHAVATHKCSGCGSENLACCSTKGTGNVATEGMEKKFQVAPVK